MSFDVDDSLWCGVMLGNNQQLPVGIVYRFPSSSDTNNSRLLSAIRGINELKQFSQVLLMGDFNVPGINWEDLDYVGSASSLASDLLDATNDAYLLQHVTSKQNFGSGLQPSTPTPWLPYHNSKTFCTLCTACMLFFANFCY